MHLCLLCDSTSNSFYKEQYYQCTNCKGIFRPIESLPTLGEEKARYDTHNNDIQDIRYQEFVSPITNAVLEYHTSTELGLDFGAGPGPVIAMLLKEKGYNIELYDPVYYDFPELLQKQYDYIFACEVIEHLHSPYEEFKRLIDILLPNGKLYCMTHLYDETIDFEKWYYKNDFTHVFIYTRETIDWIAAEFGFAKHTIENRLITFWK
ncbi:MAG: class I SAM-dependent methyltransferase [Candidatus Kapaibacterium sp.]